VCDRDADGNADLMNALRLDDPSGPLDGPGHRVGEQELVTQMAFYDDTSLTRFRAVPLPGAKTMCCGHCIAQNAPCGEDAEGVILGPFAADHTGVFTAIRAGDSVKVVLEGSFRRKDTGEMAQAVEGVWMEVLSVVPHAAVLIVDTVTKLHWLSMPRHAPKKVGADAIVAMRRGPNWASEPGPSAE
jgi:hypothetical protein